MSVEEILNANSLFLKKYRRLKPPPANGWAILTCCDRRLSGLLEAAMGFRPGEAHVVRNAGNTVTPFDNSALRSLSILVLREGVKNIAVVGHTDCRANASTMDLSRAMESAGIDREVAGSDLREFYGLTGDPAANVRSTVDRIIASGLLPVGINIYGMLLDTDTGRLTLVCTSTVEPVDVPRSFDSSAYKTGAAKRVQGVTRQDRVRGQQEVRQFTGRIKTPKEVRSPVSSIKVPVNIRTPVHEIKVPKHVTVHKKAVEVPVDIRMPDKHVDLARVGSEFEKLLTRAPARKQPVREDDRRRGQSVGSWDPAGTPKAPRDAAKAQYRFCPRCGAEYYGHVDKCADCRIRLVSAQKQGAGTGRIRPVLEEGKKQRSRRDYRRRNPGEYGRRR